MNEPIRSTSLRTLIGLHWITVLLIAAVYITIEFRGFFPRGTDARELMKWLHFSLGLTVFALLFVRAALRWRHALPAIEPALPRWQRLPAVTVHGALYLWMLAMPLLGWAILSAEGAAISPWGLPLPPLIGPADALAESLEGWHETLGNVGYVLIAVHAGAALLHHYVLGDNTLRRMSLRASTARRA